MPRLDRNQLGIFLGILAIVALQISFAGGILSKGQMIKQFHAHALTASLAQNGFDPFATTLPCASPATGAATRPWAEEPPVFHAAAAAALRLGIASPAFVPLLTGTALLMLIGAWAFWLCPAQAFWLFALAALTPCFMGYFAQHLPDLFGATWLIAGALLQARGRCRLAWLCLMLAITSKATTLFAAGAILAVDVFEPSLDRRTRLRRAAGAAILCAAASLPFLVWLRALRTLGVPNPFAFKSVVENRHSGHWGILLSRAYWGRFFTWMTLTGVGIPLFVFCALRLARLRKAIAWRQAPRAERMLALWALAVVPHWVFLRAGNYTHDYYSLPFILPLALLGALELLRLRNVVFKSALMAWSLAWGFRQPWKLARGAREGTPPSFCESERPR